MKSRKIFTIGHSTLPIGKFTELLKDNDIDILVDIRSIPGSGANPQFNAENLKRALEKAGIDYVWIKDLGGRRYGLGKKSPNVCWNNASFRGYADYMMTDGFRNGINELEKQMKGHTAAIMCAESLYWRCHRIMVSDYLKSIGHSVIHVLSNGELRPHEYTECAKVKRGKLTYC
jgi:uncharacterized protein (DUF488 family)